MECEEIKEKANNITGEILNEKDDMEIEYHSSGLKRKQELFEIRRNIILETFVEILRNIEKSL